MPLVKFVSHTIDLPRGGLGPMDIAGFSAVGVVAFGLVSWLILRMVRKRTIRKSGENTGAASLSVRRVVRAADGPSPPSHALPNPPARSSVIIPEKAITRPSRRERRSRALGRQPKIPHRLSSPPFSIAVSVAANFPAEGVANLPESYIRNSVLSAGSGQTRFSVISSVSNTSRASGAEMKRKVRQLFNPVLHDELLVASPGEQLTIMQSFDDGWCLVGREIHSIHETVTRSLFKQDPRSSEHGNVELGVVPAWCLIRPVKGLRVERPVRNSSLGVVVQLQGRGISSRDQIISWSNL